MSDISFHIESNDFTIEQILKDFYLVPDFQREYVWESSNVEKLLQDIFDEFYDENKSLVDGPEYFLGSIVVCKDHSNVFQLIDGQQRMTTIYLILCAARDYLIQINSTPTRVLCEQISYVYSDPKTGEDIERHRLTLQYEDSDGVLEKLVCRSTLVDNIKVNTQSVANILNAYKVIFVYFKEFFLDNPNEIKKFLFAFTSRIKLIRILTPSIANALKVFETINDRGVGLNAMDLLKNLLFMKTESKRYNILKDKWKTLVDTLSSCDEKPLRFLRYYIIANFDVDVYKGIREDEIYEWFFSNSNLAGIDKDPLGFLDSLIRAAKAHANFINTKDVNGNENRYLKNISLLGGALRQHHVLLLAGIELPDDLFSTLVSSIENLLFCYIITREPTKTFERSFARWSHELRSIDKKEDLDEFLERHFFQDMLALSDRFDFSMKELNQSIIQQYRIRYILAKITQYIEEQAWGNPVYSRLDMYITPSVEIEHILPQNPSDDIRKSFDRSDEYDSYVLRLGNLTLLEKTINCSISNGGFNDKFPGYKNSAFLLTRSIVEKPNVGVNTRLNKAVENLDTYSKWDSQSILSRQSVLALISRKVWGIPDKTVANTDSQDEHID